MNPQDTAGTNGEMSTDATYTSTDQYNERPTTEEWDGTGADKDADTGFMRLIKVLTQKEDDDSSILAERYTIMHPDPRHTGCDTVDASEAAVAKSTDGCETGSG